jgi:tRNA-2-methylthio-N6-dimethylallyladenosine synthase
MSRLFIHTFGCQMNEYDSAKIRAQLARDGFVSTDDPGQADVILLNTCSIRDKAEQKMHSALGEYRLLKRRGQVVTIGVAGCVAQQEGQKLLDRYPDLDLVFGPDGVPQVRRLVQEAREGRRVLDTDFLDLETYPFVDDVDPDAKNAIGAFVTIQKGCDNKCTFCIVPTTRGAEASRPSAQILAEVRALVAGGTKEITLIGQNVNSYGLKLGDRTFAQLLYAVADVPGVERIRYTTSHPRDVTDELIRAHGDLPTLAAHLHLPVQSGSNRVLRRMKRFYTREHYLGVIEALRRARPDLVLTTDFIVGFPGETEEDFGETMSLLDEVGFVASFSFKYSARPGTPALRLSDHLDEAVKGRRLTVLQDRQRELSLAWHRSLEGQVLDDVLVEGPSRHDAGIVCGRTSSNAMVNFPGSADLAGQTVAVRVTRAFTHSARGERVDDLSSTGRASTG